MAKGIRADIALVNRGLAESRARAQALIMAGQVFSGEQRIKKAGQPIGDDTALEVRRRDHPWVSRGGIKLAHALEVFALDPTGRICLDIGASTGGFTDVLLQNGAAQVFAVDVGHGQLAWRLRNDPKVVVCEKVNARHLTAEIITKCPEVITCDASFIGLKTVLPASLRLAAPGAWLAALIKPQFEAGREQVGKGGVVRDPAIHQAVCKDIEDWLGLLPEWSVQGITESPITGPEGNKEFVIAAHKENAA